MKYQAVLTFRDARDAKVTIAYGPVRDDEKTAELDRMAMVEREQRNRLTQLDALSVDGHVRTFPPGR
jgi:hypothetical protein